MPSRRVLALTRPASRWALCRSTRDIGGRGVPPAPLAVSRAHRRRCGSESQVSAAALIFVFQRRPGELHDCTAATDQCLARQPLCAACALMSARTFAGKTSQCCAPVDLLSRRHREAARGEVLQPKLRARRVGRELASCESDLPVRWGLSRYARMQQAVTSASLVPAALPPHALHLLACHSPTGTAQPTAPPPALNFPYPNPNP